MSGSEREWREVFLEFEGKWMTSVHARDREEAVKMAKRSLREELEPLSASVKVRTDICYVCGEPVEPDADKYDPKKPVYDEDMGGVYHLGCEDGVFDEVHCSVYTDN